MLRTPVAKHRRVIASAATAVVALLALSGCYRVESSFAIQDDDTIDGTVIFAVDKSVLSMTGGSIDELIPDDSVDGDATAEPYSDGDLVGKKFTLSNEPISKFNEDQADDEDGSVTVVHLHDTYVVEGTLHPTSGAGDTGDASSAVTGGTISISFSFPGEVVDANGKIDPKTNTVTWSSDDPSKPLVLHAVGKDKKSSGLAPWMLYGGGALALLVLVGVVLLLVRRSRGGDYEEPFTPRVHVWDPDAAAARPTYPSPQPTYPSPQPTYPPPSGYPSDGRVH